MQILLGGWQINKWPSMQLEAMQTLLQIKNG
jgi:hypothetical protein